MRPRLLAAFAALLALPALAQPHAGSLTGRVTSGGVPLAGATVTVTSSALIGERWALTNDGGWYFFRSLPPGLYDIVFTAAGTQTLLARIDVHVAATSRRDAELARSEGEETVTRTTLMPTLLERPELATTIAASVVDRLPVGRSLAERRALAPGLAIGRTLFLVDGVLLGDTVEEAIEETTFLTGGVSAEYASPDVAVTSTARGGDDIRGSLRATVASGQKRLFEAAAGGAIDDALWWFAAGRDSTTRGADEQMAFGRLTGGLADRHSLDAAHQTVGNTSARYSGVLAPRLTLDGLTAGEGQWAVKGHLFLANHSIVGGFDDSGRAHPGAWFVNDVWRSDAHWTFNLGVRESDGAADPRLGAVFDVRADGEHRIGATWGRFGPIDEATLTYGWRFGVGGYARADVIRRAAEETVDYVQFHGMYDVFRLFRFGGQHTAQLRGPARQEHRTNLWAWFEPSLGDGTLTLSVMQRHETQWSTDVSSMFAFRPAGEVTAFAKIDLLDAFQDRDWRAAVGVRF